MERLATLALSATLVGFTLCGCSDNSGDEDERVTPQAATAESCMRCHNGGLHDDYSGPGLENPHPFPGAATLKCTECHGGDGTAQTELGAHVPPPPEIGDRENQRFNRHAYFNRLTLTGIDKFADYDVGGTTYSALDYLQFVNPGDLRVVTDGRSCGQCHKPHVDCVEKSLLATEAGVLSGAMYAAGVPNQVPGNVGLYENTAADLGFRANLDAAFAFDPNRVGPVAELMEFPVFSRFGGTNADDIFNNSGVYASTDLPLSFEPDGRLRTGSPLANLYHEQVAFTCGDCHLGSAGANNRYGDFRSSGCTACHMRYSLDGRSRSTDPRINKFEPLDPDDIDPPERAHVRRHMIASIAQTLPSGEVVEGIDDYTCAGCHQGSNRTVMQYWGIRLDQNRDVARRVQYPANPVRFQFSFNDTRLFDPVVGNRTFNGRNGAQYLLMEDYDGDLRDDTPPDVHYEAGLGCIDCHGSHDLHGGRVGDPNDLQILSRQEQAVAIRCESCHGTAEAYAQTTTGTTYDGRLAVMATDSDGQPLRHVTRDGAGHYFLVSRLTGRRHYVPQTRDVVVDNGRTNPLDGQPIYNERASYAMGRADGDPSTGIGPQQTGGVTSGFSHGDNMSCVSCHASWTNGCIGCHLEGEYNTGNNFSNITGDRIVFRERFAEFVYQTPVPFQLGVDAHNKISPISPNTETFFRYRDQNDVRSDVFAFNDRNGSGNDPSNPYPSLSHNAMMPHSIRGRVTDDNEGPRYCVSCHLTENAITQYGTEYDTFRTAIQANDFGALDFALLQEHIGRNPGNQMDSPFWVHMVAGLGTGLYLFDANGCAVNPLDNDVNRYGCDDVAPASKVFDPASVRFNLDRIVNENGVSNGSNNHAFLEPGAGPNLRDGATDPDVCGPLGQTLIRRLTDPSTGIVLDSWIDADGGLRGNAATFFGAPATSGSD